MKELLRIFCGVLIASLSMTFVSCSDDDGPKSGGGDIKNYKFEVNGRTFYYGIDRGMDILPFDPKDDLNSQFDVLGSDYREPFTNTISLDIKGRTWIYNSLSDFNKREGVIVGVHIHIKNFNYETATSGTKLEFANPWSDNTDTEDSWDAFGNIIEWVDYDNNNVYHYHWHNGNPIGEVTFVSYKDGILGLKFNNVKMWNDLDNTNTISLSGTIYFLAEDHPFV